MEELELFFIFKVDAFQAIYYYILLIGFVVGIFSKSLDKSINLLRIYLILTFVIEISALSAAHLGKYNTWIYNIWVLIQFPVLTKVIFTQFRGKYKTLERTCFFLFIIFPLLNFFFWQGIYTINTVTMQVGAVYMVILVLSYFRITMDTPDKSIIGNPHFYVATAILIFYVGTILYYSFRNYLVNDDFAVFKEVTTILLFINWITYSLFIVAILLGRKSKKKKQKSIKI
jgi:hypothetical protein